MALARQLQLRDNLSDDVRNRQWSTLSKAHLTAAMLPVPPAGVAVLAAAAPLGGRGRGARGGKAEHVAAAEAKTQVGAEA